MSAVLHLLDFHLQIIDRRCADISTNIDMKSSSALNPYQINTILCLISLSRVIVI